MNQRILDLAVKSGHIVGELPLNANEKIQLAGLEKFAELIVRECANTIRDSVQTMERGKIRASVAHAATLIEEHFGVEG
jgi:hypothetical protein